LKSFIAHSLHHSPLCELSALSHDDVNRNDDFHYFKIKVKQTSVRCNAQGQIDPISQFKQKVKIKIEIKKKHL
jgi:hypothetical protein